MVLPHGPQTAGDCQIVYELDREAVERAAEYGTLEDEIQRQKTHISTLPNDSEEDDRSSDTRGSQVGTDYKYLEWTTPVEELCPNPGQLPRGVIEVVDPFRWGNTKKNVTLALCCASTFVAAYTAGAYTSGLAQMEVEWNMERVPLLVGVTCYTTGFAIAPMFLAPLSEVYGRRNVFLASYILFTVCTLACALTDNYAGMLVARIFLGVGGSTFSTLCGGVISDIYHAEFRGFPMACFSTVALFGTGAGPLVSGFIAEYMNWRWIHWVQLIFNAVLLVAAAIWFKETRGSVLLIRRAKALNKYLDEHCHEGVDPATEKGSLRVRWKVKAEEERAGLSQMVRVSLTRPFHLLFTEPVVFFFSLWTAFSWGILYLFLQGVPLVFQTSHKFTISQVGSVFTSMCIASFLALGLNSLVEGSARRFMPQAKGPETRLYASCTLGALLPIGMFWFGWTSFPSQHWILPTCAVGAVTIGIFSVYLAVFNYFADTYHRYASSALAAQSFCRNMLAGFFPLITDAMYHRMTFQGASSFLGGVGLMLSIIPWVLVVYGDRIRRRSKFASEIMEV